MTSFSLLDLISASLIADAHEVGRRGLASGFFRRDGPGLSPVARRLYANFRGSLLALAHDRSPSYRGEPVARLAIGDPDGLFFAGDDSGSDDRPAEHDGLDARAQF
jgi:hypothetical protein